MEISSIDQIRSVTFPHVRKGYDPREVEKFLGNLADWLETGGGDQTRADLVRRELQRVGEKTATLLTSAEDTAEQLRADAEHEADKAVRDAQAAAKQTRAEADAYAGQVTGDADAYAAKMRGDADAYSSETRSAADQYAETTRTAADQDAERRKAVSEQRAHEMLETAERKAKRIVNEGTKRRREIEAVIADLVGGRNSVVADAKRLSEELAKTAAAHTPERGADPFATPRKLDPGEGAKSQANGEAPVEQAEAEQSESRQAEVS